MSKKTMSRRELMKDAVQLPLIGSLLALGACSKSDKMVCANPDALTPGEASLLQSLNYTEKSPHADKSCSGCGFFAASGANGCGHCEMLKVDVNPGGHCNSWSAKS